MFFPHNAEVLSHSLQGATWTFDGATTVTAGTMANVMCSAGNASVATVSCPASTGMNLGSNLSFSTAARLEGPLHAQCLQRWRFTLGFGS